MIPKISFLFLISLAYLLMQTCEGQTWAAFQRKHIYYPMPQQIPNPGAECSQMMMGRGMTTHKCKPTNTFINDTIANILDICRSGGYPSVNPTGYFDSRNYFKVLQCDRPRGTPPNCVYRGALQSNHLRVDCDAQQRPKHLEPVLP